jgi:hypothetical protein
MHSKTKKAFTASVFSMGALALFTVGCSMEGQWSLKEVTPTAAQRDFQYRTLTLQDDGSFYAEASEGEHIRTTSGTYEYDPQKKTLHLEEHDGECHTYDAEFKAAGQELQLAQFWNGGKLEARFERERAQP